MDVKCQQELQKADLELSVSHTSEMIELLERQCQRARDKNALRAVEKLTAGIIDLKVERRLLRKEIESGEKSQ